jgi:hypothetical protein
VQLGPSDLPFISKITIEQGTGRPANFNMELKNVNTTGLSDVEIIASRYVACSVATVPRLYAIEIWA